MNSICILPCGKKKAWDMNPYCGPQYAKDAYQGTLHKKSQQYARKHGLPWVVLSAKHGFLFPYDIVPENYDIGFHFSKEHVINDRTLRQQWLDKHLSQVHTIVLLTGKKHARVVKRSVPCPDDYTWCEPLQGVRGIGEMLQRLSS
ncbi:hypothetical protein SAMN05192534_10591 [Alteribacillus persepolensis]|uniref:DUF6884 domain-containing protein n=1 Tax=Alteribacillus persepolensis TaxID=568899 RepID=A0A1G8C828_9BACI|nr:DUF6884 domain-containing protein [Alteribacillus persepolensis]SDH41538.1 hypothetical protein SAMN05192534_10591 [Alteribacillus persepolensis]